MRLSDLHRRVQAGKKFAFLLDEFPNAAAAYSLRKLRSAYTGNCIEVRRSSDNALQNIGFVNNRLDTASLLSFVGVGDGFVRTWYDQSGNTRNAVETTNDNQPRIVNSGVLEVKNSKPSINWYQNQIRLSIQHNSVFNWTNSSQITNIIVASGAKLNSSRFIEKSLANQFFPTSANGFQSQQSGNTSVTGNVDVLTGDYFINHSYLNGNISANIYANDQLSATTTTLTSLGSSSNTAILYVGNRAQGDRTLIGFIGELVIYPTDQSSNRNGIQKNINDYYNIF
jgi:hypothetical protein